MARKELRYATFFWEDYTGAKWNNVEVANGGEGLGSYVHPQGKDSKTAYKPKSLFYHYRVGGLDRNKHKIDDVNFKLFIRKFNPSENDLPTIKVFYGDNNAPYTKSPIKVVRDYTRLKNDYWYDNYSLNYNLKGVTFDQLKDLIIEVDWSRTKVSYATTISVNRGRLEVDYSLKNPKWSLYETVNKTSATTNDKIAWKLTAKNTGYCGNGSVTLQLPKGVSVVSSTGEGTYNNTTKTWTFSACTGQSEVRTFYLKSSSVGLKELKALNNSQYATNLNVTRQVTFIKYNPPVLQPTKAVHRDDIITYTFYDTFENEDEQYFDVQIQGMKENHPQGGACYRILSSNNVELTKPLRTYVELLTEEDNINIKEIVRDSTVTYGNITVDIDDDTVCFKLDDTSSDFVANIRVYMYCNDDTTGTITTYANNKTYTGTFDILPMRGNKFFVDESISRDKSYVVNSLNIGSPSVWTINLKAHRHNFFDEKKDLMEIEIEEAIAYIGVIPLSRCHKADVTATSKNSLIENRYLNRAYYGKKGDYSEDIKMTLRMKWQDVATLQGLVEMDKPIPIDTIPNRADGDPLNHRGWAEIYEVSNIKKINDMLYECDVGVTYLTHDILTKFNIKEAKKITEASIKYYLSLIHNYNDDLLDLFKLNYYEFWTTLEDVNGDKTGSYNIEPNTSLIMNRDLNKNSTYDIIWRNTLPQLMSEDYDGNWEMALRVRNKTNGNTLFEHSYSNFKHYDFDTAYAVNTADADTKFLYGNDYNTLNHEKISLGYDSLAPLIEDRKTATHFNSMENMTIDNPNDDFEVFLCDDENKGISNQTIKVHISNDDGYSDTFSTTTDIYGRAFFKLNFGNGTYNIKFTYAETNKYRSCDYTTTITINFDEVRYHFEHQQTNVANMLNYPYSATLLDENDDGVSGMLLHYSFKDVGSDTYGYERTVVTDENGNFTVPIDWDNGTKTLRVLFKGFVDDGTIYEPVMMEEQINISIFGESVKIEADDVTLVQGEDVTNYNVILKNSKDEVLENKDIIIAFYNGDINFVKPLTTDEYGVASVPLYLNGDSWNVDIHFKGDETYKPLVETHSVTIEKFTRKATRILSENLTLDEDWLREHEEDFYTITLIDENGDAVVDEPVSFTVENGNNIYVNTVLITDENGKIGLPFVSHSENVVITSTYNGCVAYAPCEKVDEVICAEKTGKASVSFSIDNSTNKIMVTEGNVTKEITQSNNIRQVIVSKPSNPRQSSNNGRTDYQSLGTGTYNVTIYYRDSIMPSTYYSLTRTLSYTHNTDTRMNLSQYAHRTGYYIVDGVSIEGKPTNKVYKYPVWANWDCGKTTGTWYFVDPNEVNVETATKQTIIENAIYTVKSVSTQKALETFNGDIVKYAKWGFDAYFLHPPNTRGVFYADDTDHYIVDKGFVLKPLSDENFNESVLSETGFGYGGETYQNITISNDTVSTTDIDEQVFDYYVMKVLNVDTDEMLTFYSYLTDKTTTSQLSFLLSQGDYELQLIGSPTDSYKGYDYRDSATLDVDTDITIPTTGDFNDPNNYVELEKPLTFTETGFEYESGRPPIGD